MEMDKSMKEFLERLDQKVEALGQKVDALDQTVTEKFDAQDKAFTKKLDQRTELLRKEMAAGLNKQSEATWLLRQELQEQAQRNFDILERDLTGAMEWAKSLQKQKVDKKALKHAVV